MKPFEWWKDRLEAISFVCIILGAIVAYFEWYDKKTEDRVTAAHKAYDDVDARFVDFLHACADHPEIDCNSRSLDAAQLQSAEFKLGPLEKERQRVVYTMLIDLFEVAYQRYHDPVFLKALGADADDQWSGWLKYYNKFMIRPAFKRVWDEVGDEYVGGLQKCINAIVRDLPAA